MRSRRQASLSTTRRGCCTTPHCGFNSCASWPTTTCACDRRTTRCTVLAKPPALALRCLFTGSSVACSACCKTIQHPWRKRRSCCRSSAGLLGPQMPSGLWRRVSSRRCTPSRKGVPTLCHDRPCSRSASLRQADRRNLPPHSLCSALWRLNSLKTCRTTTTPMPAECCSWSHSSCLPHRVSHRPRKSAASLLPSSHPSPSVTPWVGKCGH